MHLTNTRKLQKICPIVMKFRQDMILIANIFGNEQYRSSLRESFEGILVLLHFVILTVFRPKSFFTVHRNFGFDAS